MQGMCPGAGARKDARLVALRTSSAPGRASGVRQNYRGYGVVLANTLIFQIIFNYG
jgi:hypothetical protein